MLSRRTLLRASAASVALGACSRPDTLASGPSGRIRLPLGVQSGEVHGGEAILWSAADRPAQLQVRWDTTPRFQNARTIRGEVALPARNLTARAVLTGLPPGQTVHYQATFLDPAARSATALPVVGQFRTPPGATDRRSVRLAWSGDTAGQGWGINPDIGGMVAYRAIQEVDPDLFIHCGDTIYADGPLQEEVVLPDGRRWRNRLTPAVTHVAETQEDFWGRFAYNLLDENVRTLYAAVAQAVLWDDHEVVNNWYPGEILQDERYTERRVDVLRARAAQAFADYTPTRSMTPLYRHFSLGPHLDVFRLDMRAHRGPNTANREETAQPFLGGAQVAWLREALRRSTATWRVIAADMPLGLVVPDGEQIEGLAQGDGPPLGRELELAALLRELQAGGVRNVVWITADVHYAAAHHYHPSRARFTDFEPFWEFVSGPLNAGTFGPNALDNTFGPEVVFQKVPPAGQANLSPLDGLQFFGQLDIDGESGVMTVRLKDLYGETIFSQEITPV